MKIIIHIDDVAPATALSLVDSVVRMGLISETANGKQYCFHASFLNHTYDVSAKKSKGETHTFYVYKGQRYDTNTANT